MAVKKILLKYKGYTAVLEYTENGHVRAIVREFPGSFTICAASVDEAKSVFKQYVGLQIKREQKAAMEKQQAV